MRNRNLFVAKNKSIIEVAGSKLPDTILPIDPHTLLDGYQGSLIQELVALLKNAEVLGDDEISKTKVSLGCTVVVRDEETKEEETYELVNANEEDIFAKRISMDSPLGQAINGKKKGQVVEVTTPAGSFKYKVIKIGK